MKLSMMQKMLQSSNFQLFSAAVETTMKMLLEVEGLT
jgi:hypothetical protein